MHRAFNDVLANAELYKMLAKWTNFKVTPNVESIGEIVDISENIV